MTYRSNVLFPPVDGRSTPIFQTTRRHIPVERNLDIQSRESLKSQEEWKYRRRTDGSGLHKTALVSESHVFAWCINQIITSESRQCHHTCAWRHSDIVACTAWFPLRSLRRCSSSSVITQVTLLHNYALWFAFQYALYTLRISVNINVRLSLCTSWR